MNFSEYSRVALALATCIVLGSALAFADTDQASPLDTQGMKKLTDKGIRLDDEWALIQCVKSRDSGLAPLAAYALAKLPKSETIVTTLREAANGEQEVLIIYAIRSLLKFGDTMWVGPALGRLDSMSIPHMQVQLAGLLAEAGHYEGWRFVTEAVTTSTLGDSFVFDALETVPSFKGMRNPAGGVVDLVAELQALKKRARESIRPLIDRQIEHLAVPKPIENQR